MKKKVEKKLYFSKKKANNSRYFRIYKTLLEKQMLKNYATKDILLFLAHIKKLKINNNWLQAEITQKSQKIIDLLREI